MPAISFQSVAKDFGALNVLKDISLDIQDGEFVVFVGPSGCGKSTLLRILAGLETASRGDIFIHEDRVNELPPKDRDVAMVFQNYALYPHMSVYQNLEFPLRNQGMPKLARHKEIMKAANMLGLDPYMERYPRELSGGQRQRVAMGRAIVREPQVFLFDEPLSNLDAALRGQMRKETKLLHNRLKSTMIYVTHDQVEAMTMADRIVVMKDGEIQQVGTPEEIYQIPANTFVASFVGTPKMNIFNGQITDGTKGPVFALEENDFQIPLQADSRFEPGGEFIRKVAMIGVRPEHVKAYVPNSNRPANGRVEHVESDGRDVTLTVLSGKLVVSILDSSPATLSAAESVAIEFPPNSIVFFDKHGQKL